VVDASLSEVAVGSSVTPLERWAFCCDEAVSAAAGAIAAGDTSAGDLAVSLLALWGATVAEPVAVALPL